MNATEFELLRQEIKALRADMDIQFAVVEAKLDAKPGYAALYQAVVTLAFGIGAVVTSTVVVLKNIGLLGAA